MAKKKAFLGAAIGAVTGIAQGIIGAHQQKKAQQRANVLQNRADTYQEAAALTQARANDFELQNQFNDRIEMKCGGSARRKRCGGTTKRAKLGTEVKYSDRLDTLRCGGRRCRK